MNIYQLFWLFLASLSIWAIWFLFIFRKELKIGVGFVVVETSKQGKTQFYPFIVLEFNGKRYALKENQADDLFYALLFQRLKLKTFNQKRNK